MFLVRRTVLGALAGLVVCPTLAHARTLARKRTRYGRLKVVEEDGLVVLLEDGQIHSAYDPAQPTRLVYDYLEVMADVVSVRPSGGRALVVGLGGGSIGRWLLDAGYAVDGVDINPHVIRLSREHLALDPRISVHIGDGRAFVEEAPGKWDVIVLDAQSEDYVPPHLLTEEWFASVRSRLTPGGWALMNSWQHAPRGPDELATWASVFPESWIVTRRNSPWDNRILVGTTGGTDPTAGLAERVEATAVEDPKGTIRRDPR